MKRLTALLCAVLLVLTACGKAPETTEPPQTTAVPTTVDLGPTPAEIYAEAAAEIEGREELKLEVTCIQETKLGVDTFKETLRQELALQGIGTDSFAGRLDGNCYSGSYHTENYEIFRGGMFYAGINDDHYKATMTGEEFLDRQVPAVLLDESLYENVEQTTDRVMTFSGATALEAWLDNPYATLESAEGTAELDTSGRLVRSTYKAVYRQGTARVDLSVTVRISDEAAAPVEAPENPDSYTLLDTPVGPGLVHTAIGYLLQAQSIESTIVEMDVLQAANCVDISTMELNTYGKTATQIAKFDQDYYSMDLSSREELYSYTVEDTYMDGVLTTVEDGGEPVSEDGYDPSGIRSYAESWAVSLMPDTTRITDYDLTQVGDVLILEYTWDEDMGEEKVDQVLDSLLVDPDGYREAASAYITQEASGVIGLDASTLMPLGAVQTFTGAHHIDGQNYVTSVSFQQSLRLGGGETYAAITGEAPPEEEPEEKATPLFYHVTGENGQEMWLLGTIHVGDVRTKYLPQEIYDAFDASDALAVEFESDAFMEQSENDEELMNAIMEAYLYTDGTSMRSHIQDTELYDRTIQLLKATGQYNQTIEMYKPYFVAQLLNNHLMGHGYALSSDYGVDFLLEDMANEQGKEIRSVETGLSQIQMLAGFSDELQERLLQESVDYGHVYSNMATEELFELWCAGNEADLIEAIVTDTSELTEEERVLVEEYEKAVGTDRNEQMHQVAEGYLESGDTVFYAVGLAHLLAEDGLVNTLRAAGYTVELVSYSG